MTRDQELFGAALMIARRHGAGAASFAAARIEEFTLKGESDAIALWEEIAVRLPLSLERVAALPS